MENYSDWAALSTENKFSSPANLPPRLAFLVLIVQMRMISEQSTQRNIELQGRAVAALNARVVPADMLAPGFSLKNCASAVADYTYRGAAGWREPV